ncbi:TRAM domain-containing protein [Patescibacteria group bacterium]|nr:TRAM domain-containing protein [Patescibacteria group bacterium]
MIDNGQLQTGQYVRVKITDVKSFSLYGEMVGRILLI